MSGGYSGKRVVQILVHDFDFVVARQKGSHVVLKKLADKEVVTTVVPLHRELATGTLRGVLRLAKVEFDDFLKHV